eukprot:CAMPEP_0118672206 /NCGR_PEP_ID=MMETSP0785-20121206/22416_1 /TAXON_ID=91992 /ORGANISM="Bolidomonas pacifica, Strain CCMP 1866" /LENGTH=469 /DNA_ID=CAMNT_0006567151 /DNA_START=61 /DNA_END=1466 /DNA_ORIENTATION=-
MYHRGRMFIVAWSFIRLLWVFFMVISNECLFAASFCTYTVRYGARYGARGGAGRYVRFSDAVNGAFSPSYCPFNPSLSYYSSSSSSYSPYSSYSSYSSYSPYSSILLSNPSNDDTFNDESSNDEEKARIEAMRAKLESGVFGVTSDGVASDGVASDGVTSDGVTSDSVTSDSVTSDSVTSDSVTSNTDNDDANKGDGSNNPLTSSTIPSSLPLNNPGPNLWSIPLVPSNGPPPPNFKIQPGQVLLAKPSYFTQSRINKKSRSPMGMGSIDNLLQKYGLTTPLPQELGPDRIADLLPVLLVVEVGMFSTTALLLNRRTGYLLGDLQQGEEGGGIEQDSRGPSTSSPLVSMDAFMIQPLWFGGTSGGSGMSMIHLAGDRVKGAKRITDDGIWYGGDVVEPISGFSFKFFVQTTKFLPLVLEKEVNSGLWLVASVSKDVIFKGRDRAGSKRAKPLWKEIIELADENGWRDIV